MIIIIYYLFVIIIIINNNFKLGENALDITNKQQQQQQHRMEAVARYAYTANSASELSFSAGDTMKVTKIKINICRSGRH